MPNNDQNHDEFEETLEDEEFEFEDEIVEEEGISNRLKKLREDLKKAQKEKEEYLSGWQRAQADVINANKRADEAASRGKARAHEDLLTDLLPVLDAFSMASQNKDAWERVDSEWRKGIEHIHANLLKVLSENGLEEIKINEGDPFDAELHHSASSTETDREEEDDTIARVIQKGYRLKGEVLRPALVSVYRFEKWKA